MFSFNEIGIVKNKIFQTEGAFQRRHDMSTILVHDEYKKGLYGIEEHEYLHVLFYLHESQPKDLKLDGLEYKGGFKGVFASRAPNRPSLIGLTTVRLLERNGRELIVWGLDTINGTPVLDIKPLALDMDMFYAMEAEKIVEIYPTLDAMKCKERA